MKIIQKKIRLILSLACFAITVMFLWGASPVQAQASGRTVSIDSCLISGDQVVCSLSASQVPASDDGLYYIYSNEVFQDGTTGTIVASGNAAAEVALSFPLQYNTTESNLSRKFLVAVKQNGQMVQVSNEHYITNPEAVAIYTTEPIQAGIKGLLPNGDIVKSQVEELGIQQVVYNMIIDQICASADTPGAIPFGYNGQIYYFNKDIVQAYDGMSKYLNNLGIKITMVLLHSGTGEHTKHLIHPQAVGAECPGYALNVEDAEAVNHLKAIAAFLGQRYSGKGEGGQIDNWILGNEVNARTSWWYTNSESIEFNVNIYVEAFRIFYNELKGMNGNVMLYNSIDQEWNRKSNPGSFLAKEYLDKFNIYIKQGGNIDWGLSFHPYNSPLFDPYAWNGLYKWVKNDLTTPYITMQNLDILINYMNRLEFRNPSGEVRSISLAEIGFTSSFGQDLQEASIAYGYLKAASIPEIDAFMLFRELDDAHEMESNLAMGLLDLEGNRKPAFEIYKNLGTANEASAKVRASEIIGMDIDEMINQKIIWTRMENGAQIPLKMETVFTTDLGQE